MIRCADDLVKELEIAPDEELNKELEEIIEILDDIENYKLPSNISKSLNFIFVRFEGEDLKCKTL